MTYNNSENFSVLNQITTLDLIGFEGAEFVSQLITFMQAKVLSHKDLEIEPKISHVGLAIHGKDLNQYIKSPKVKKNININELYIFESTMGGRLNDNVLDICGQTHFGAQIRFLKDVIINNDAQIYYSKKNFVVTQDMIKLFVEFINQHNYRPYEKSSKSLFGSIFSSFRQAIPTESVFCSELVAKALQRCKLMSKEINPESVVPFDFYPDPINPTITLDVDKLVPLLFYPPICIKA